MARSTLIVAAAPVIGTDNKVNLFLFDGQRNGQLLGEIWKFIPSETATVALSVVNGTGSGLHLAEDLVSIAANPPAQDKVFDKWTGDTAHVADVNAASTTLTMPAANVTVTATHKDQPVQVTLTVEVNPVTDGSVTGNGINCPGDCTEDYDANTEVVLTAAPAQGMRFL